MSSGEMNVLRGQVSTHRSGTGVGVGVGVGATGSTADGTLKIAMLGPVQAGKTKICSQVRREGVGGKRGADEGGSVNTMCCCYSW